MRERAPDAQIILVGYPQIFPDPANGGCAQLPLATGDLGYARDVNVGLNESMAAAAKTTGVEYVDVFTPMLDAQGKPRGELFGGDALHLKGL